jgi:ORF6N domain
MGRQPKTSAIVPLERIESRILLIRGHKVMLDSDLAELYGVTTKRLNEQVKRNRERFPADFMFQLTSGEATSLTSQIRPRPKRKSRSLSLAVLLDEVLREPAQTLAAT